MKSAYELAMERLEESAGPAQKLNDEQKARLAAIDQRFDAQAAEAKLGFDEKKATAPRPEWAALQAELASSLASIEERRQREKDAVWNEVGGA